MKKSLLLLLAVLCSGYKVWAQDCSTIPPNNDQVYHWCYQQNEGTSWNTTPYKAYILNGMPFRLLFPKGFDSTAVSTKKYPLVILLHGIGQSGTDNNHQLKYGCEDHLKALNSGAYDGFVMVPQSPESLWGTSQRSAVLKFVELAIRDLKVDQFRVQLEGYSGGATAAWKLAYENPKIFAAAIPMSSADGTIASWAETLKYTAIWHAQGGRDTQPAPNAGNNVAKSFQNVGANYKYQYYHDLGHGTWFAMYKEPDFFPFLMRNSQLRIHAKYFKYNFCEGEAVSGIMGVTQGFEDYEWRKNAQLISGANANELNFSGEGAYTVRIKHKGVWSAWSEALNVQRIAPTPTPTVIATGPTALPSLDGKRTVTLRAPKGFQDYKWSNNSTLDSLVVTTAGSYSASVTEAYGCPSAFSAPVKVTFNAVGVLPAPGNLTVATTSETSLTLNWSDNSSNETGFEIYRRTSTDVPWSLVAQLPANRSSYEDKGLQPYTRYHYSIRSVNNDGGSVYISGTGKTSADLQSPGIPASLEVTKTSRTSIGLKWQPAADNASASGITYQIFANNKTTLLATTTKTELTLQGLAEMQSYNFAVRAIDEVGNISDFSNQVSSSTHIDGLYYTYYEGGVSNVHNISLLDPIKSGRIPNVDIVTNRRRDDYFAFKFEGYLNITTAGTYTFYTTSDDGSTLTINGVQVVNNNGRHTSQERSGTINLTAGLHEFTVLYFEANGNGEKLEVRWQGPGITKQLMPDAAFKENFSLPGKPVAPGNLTATATDHQSILLKWTDNSSNESGFEVFRSASSGGPYQLVKTTAANATQYSDAGLQAATNYHYKVRAIGNTGESTYSAQVSSSTTAAPAILPAPASLKAFRQSATAAALSWTDQADFESGFEIWRGTDGVTFTKIMTLGSNATSFTDNTISSSNSFHYRIRAVYNSTYSAWSNVTALSTGNKAPVIGGLQAQVSAPESTTTEILFDLSDPEGASLQLTSRYLPTFARIEQASATKGRIILNPGVKDIGYYSGIQLTASDGQLETDVTFSISVKNDEKTAIYINMGNSSVAGKPWNNTNPYGGVTNK
ncbi:MAG: fibronectin type III domain-containing protein, partial [Bacteroidetes bacterium]|nr:fibronectin type III domain-containing protein [Bacteroidota bacterium]